MTFFFISSDQLNCIINCENEIYIKGLVFTVTLILVSINNIKSIFTEFNKYIIYDLKYHIDSSNLFKLSRLE